MSDDSSFFHVLVPDPKLPRYTLHELSTSDHLFDLEDRSMTKASRIDEFEQVVIAEGRRRNASDAPAAAWCPRCSIPQEKPTWRIVDRQTAGAVHASAYMPAFNELDNRLQGDRDLAIVHELNFNSFLESHDMSMDGRSALQMSSMTIYDDLPRHGWLPPALVQTHSLPLFHSAGNDDHHLKVITTTELFHPVEESLSWPAEREPRAPMLHAFHSGNKIYDFSTPTGLHWEQSRAPLSIRTPHEPGTSSPRPVGQSSAGIMQHMSSRRNLLFLDQETLLTSSGLQIVSDYC
mmetsp:Transcript_1231/g.2658  ORF Transcript_1231/g.2658 Transcript_1231/m.2658 type:complete len:291 (-) Transcript_1231:150-1022(-)